MFSRETYKIRGNGKEIELGKVGNICECGGIWLQSYVWVLTFLILCG